MNFGSVLKIISAAAALALAAGASSALPAMTEILPGFEVNSWYGMMAPAGTPKAKRSFEFIEAMAKSRLATTNELMR